MTAISTIFTSSTTSSGLDEATEAAFIEAYCEAAPAGYDAEADCEGPQPWCCPWYSMSTENWQEDLLDKLVQTGGDIREAAKLYALSDYDELAEILAEEADNEDEGEPESRIFYQVGNVPNVGPHDELWESLEDAMNYMASRGYVYVDSAAYGPDGEDAYYFVHPSHAEEKDINTSRPGWENAADLLDDLYGYGYEPCLLPVIRD